MIWGWLFFLVVIVLCDNGQRTHFSVFRNEVFFLMSVTYFEMAQGAICLIKRNR